MIVRPFVAIAGLPLAGLLLWMTVPSHKQLAEFAAQSGAWSQAADLLEQAVAEQPHDGALFGRLIEAYHQAGRDPAALARLEHEALTRRLTPAERRLARTVALAAGQPKRALSLLTAPNQPGPADEHTTLAALALHVGDVPLARRVYARHLAAHPRDSATLARMRDLALAASDMNAALQAQRRLCELAPSAAHLAALEGLLLQAGKPAEALDVHERLGARPPELSWCERGERLAALSGRPDRAVPHLWALYQARGTEAAARSLLAALGACRHPRAATIARLLLGRHGEASAVRREAEGLLLALNEGPAVLAARQARAARHRDDAAAHRDVVALALQLERRDAAINELERWVARRPGDREEAHRLAQLLAWSSRAPEAARLYARLLAEPTGLSRATETSWLGEWIAVAEPGFDHTPTGLRALCRLLALDPGHMEARRRLAWARGERHERALALAEARRIASDRRAVPADRQRLGEWLLAAGEVGEGLERLVAADRAHPLGPDALARAAYAASDTRRWQPAGYFFGRLTAERPSQATAWEGLAWVREQAGDTAGAIVAWQRRLGLGQPEQARLQAARLLQGAGRIDEAFATLGPANGEDALRLKAALAGALGRPDAEAAALAALVGLQPADAALRLVLGDVCAKLGDRAAAEAHFDAALRLKPADAEMLMHVTVRAQEAGSGARYDALLARLAALGAPPEPALRLLALRDQDEAPVEAVRWLDALHARSSGDGASWLLRGELAARLGDAEGARSAFVRALAHADAERPDEREAHAMALERLGRDEEAVGAWLAIAEATPQRPAAVLALARRCLAAGDAEGAARYVARARAIAPAAFETRLLEADALMAEGRAAEALPILSALNDERPRLVFLVVSQALAHARLGEVRRAYRLAVEAQALAPADEGLGAMVREFRARGASQVRLTAGEERLGAWTRAQAGLSTEAVVDDRWRLTGTLRRLDWGVAGTAQEGGVGASWQSGHWRAEARMAFAAQAGAAQAPLPEASLRWEAPTLGLQAGAAESRWDETPQSLLAAGRERRGEAAAWWRPLPALSLRGGLAAGILSLGGAPVGASRTLSAEATLRPIAQVPWTLSYGLRQRAWGQAGPAVGLPTGLTAHTLALGYAAAAGPWRLALQPGYGLEATTGRQGPTLVGTLIWEPGSNGELRLSGGWSGANLLQGGPDGYHQLELGGHWWW